MVDASAGAGAEASSRAAQPRLALLRRAGSRVVGRAAIEADAAVDFGRIVTAVEDAGYEARIVGPA